jgi:hypothetical protein
MPAATLECSLCQTRRLWDPGETESKSLIQYGAAILPCDVCGRGTFWVHSDEDRRSNTERRDTSFSIDHGKGTLGGEDRRVLEDRRMHRGPRRVPLTLPVRVRGTGSDQFEELTKTSNVSRGGIHFYTERSYRVGQQLLVVMKYSPNSQTTAVEQRAEVVRVDAADAKTRGGVALKFLY